MELLHLLSIVERIIPVRGEEWDQVRYNIAFCIWYGRLKACITGFRRCTRRGK
jgi:hypothetical protein